VKILEDRSRDVFWEGHIINFAALSLDDPEVVPMSSCVETCSVGDSAVSGDAIKGRESPNSP
jgi:hypothetical protein